MPTGYGASLIQTLLALGAVCVLAWVGLKWSARRGIGRLPSGDHLRVVERVALDARRQLYLVQVGERLLLVGTGDGGAPAVLAELGEGEIPVTTEEQPARFAEVLRRFGRRTGADP